MKKKDTPKLGKDGWPEWVWVYSRGYFKSESFMYAERENFTNANCEVMKELTDQIYREFDRIMSENGVYGPKDGELLWNRAMANLGYDVPEEYMETHKP